MAVLAFGGCDSDEDSDSNGASKPKPRSAAVSDKDLGKLNTHGTDDDLPGKGSIPGTRKTAVRALLGPPEQTLVKRGTGSSRFPCDVYRKPQPNVQPKSQYVLLCYDKGGRLAVISYPYTPETS